MPVEPLVVFAAPALLAALFGLAPGKAGERWLSLGQAMSMEFTRRFPVPNRGSPLGAGGSSVLTLAAHKKN